MHVVSQRAVNARCRIEVAMSVELRHNNKNLGRAFGLDRIRLPSRQHSDLLLVARVERWPRGLWSAPELRDRDRTEQERGSVLRGGAIAPFQTDPPQPIQ